MTPLAPILGHLRPELLETIPVLRKVGSAGRALAELKGLASSIPRPAILVNTLVAQEAKDSSAIENIVTTDDEIFRDELFPEESADPAANEVQRYREALKAGNALVQETGLLTANHIHAIHAELGARATGFRKLPGTVLKDGAGNVVYTPPQGHPEIVALMADLEVVMNDPAAFPCDPLVKMALVHHQFESIHPFYDGNGRTGRIMNVLYLVKEGLLDTPILYLSRHIVRNKGEYYRLLQAVRERGAWKEWTLFMLDAVEVTARETSGTVAAIQAALLDYKRRIRAAHKFYSQDLVAHLFSHPYTRVAFLERELGVSRITATRYLDALAADGLLDKRRVGRSNCYVNVALVAILSGEPEGS